MSDVKVTSAVWGKTPGGAAVSLFTLRNEQLAVRLTDYGARLVELIAPDRNGEHAGIVLGCSSVEGFVADTSFLGATIGRFANRIDRGRFTLDGVAYELPINNPPNTLHGGPDGFDRCVWSAAVVDGNAVEFSIVSPDGDEGFPGEMYASVRYTLEGHDLRLEYTATTTKPTIVNLTNHSYFNLAGEGSGDVLAQQLRIEADAFTPATADSIPTGEIVSVEGTPFDFRKPMSIGAHIRDEDFQLTRARGYDQSFVLRGEGGQLREAAEAHDPASGRTLTVFTTEPSVHFYSGNYMEGETIGHSGRPYEQFAGFALETQHYADSPNHPNFPSTTLRPGETFRSTTIFRFTAR